MAIIISDPIETFNAQEHAVTTNKNKEVVLNLSLTLAKNNGVHHARGMRNIGSLLTIS